ncbi:putative ferredoxin [Klebsiella quasipneumoniae]|nr:putative ferredoxin [Klebsiella quasipneumoniae]
MSEINPCMTCGACCAYFRVSFYWAEADDAGGLVPSALTEPLTPFLRCMSGTNQRQGRCAALSGASALWPAAIAASLQRYTCPDRRRECYDGTICGTIAG